MNLDNVTIIGTSHIAKGSVKEIKETFEKLQPDVVAVELDRQRVRSLFEPEQKLQFSDMFKVGVKGYVFAVIGRYAEKKLGKVVGTKPGADMKQAVILAKKNGKKIALIDQHIAITLKRLSKAISGKEIRNFLWDIVSGIFRKKQPVEFDLNNVPSKKVIQKLLEYVKVRYPNVYKVLIEERNVVMAKKLVKVMHLAPDKKIMAVIGAGHEDDVWKLLRKYAAAQTNI